MTAPEPRPVTGAGADVELSEGIRLGGAGRACDNSSCDVLVYSPRDTWAHHLGDAPADAPPPFACPVCRRVGIDVRFGVAIAPGTLAALRAEPDSVDDRLALAWHEGHLAGVEMQHLIETGEDSWPDNLATNPYGVPSQLAGTYAPPDSVDDDTAGLRAAWLAGFRAHRDGDLRCPHGYEKGDHHWESGDCLTAADPAGDERGEGT